MDEGAPLSPAPLYRTIRARTLDWELTAHAEFSQVRTYKSGTEPKPLDLNPDLNLDVGLGPLLQALQHVFGTVTSTGVFIFLYALFYYYKCSSMSTGVFIFLYALFYYYKRSNMSGTLQTVEFFGYTILICYAFFLSLGTVSFFASLKFIRYIYVNLKMD
ncbi:Transmembrane 9 super member 1 [Branchiostoma belcheri]|nr:Transmembrane 9 super member 1 [Branchiostoma belcheri]